MDDNKNNNSQEATPTVLLGADTESTATPTVLLGADSGPSDQIKKEAPQEEVRANADLSKPVTPVATTVLLDTAEPETSATPEAPQEATPEAPQEATPAAPQEEAPAAPQEETPAAPQEETPAAPQEEAPAAPQEVVPAAPQEEVRANADLSKPVMPIMPTVPAGANSDLSKPVVPVTNEGGSNSDLSKPVMPTKRKAFKPGDRTDLPREEQEVGTEKPVSLSMSQNEGSVPLDFIKSEDTLRDKMRKKAVERANGGKPENAEGKPESAGEKAENAEGKPEEPQKPKEVTLLDDKDPMHLKKDTKLSSDRYQIKGTLRFNDRLVTYVAYDTKLEMDVILKEYFPKKLVNRMADDDEVMVNSGMMEGQREYRDGMHDFTEKARLAKRIPDSKYICKTLDIFEANNTAYVAMELLSGSTLKEVVDGRGYNNIPKDVAVIYMNQLLDAVDLLHQQGFLHCGISPEHLFICDDGTLKIISFEDLSMFQRKYAKNDFFLNDGYSAPEQYNEEGKVGSWTDLYSIGATLYFLFTGKTPPEATDREKKDALTPLVSVDSSIPGNINAAVLSAMMVRGVDRPQMVKDFRKKLENKNSRAPKLNKKPVNVKKTAELVLVFVLLIVGCVEVFTLWRKGYFVSGNNLTVWLAVSDDAELAQAEKERYEQVFSLYKTKKPKVKIELVTVPESKIADKFLKAEKKEQPDLLEIIEPSKKLYEQLSDLSYLEDSLKSSRDALKVSKKTDYKAFPLARAVEVVLLAENATMKDGKKMSSVKAFIEGEGKRYVVCDSSAFAMAKDALFGEIAVLPAEGNAVWYTDFFGVNKRSVAQEKEAKALLEYLASADAQRMMHIVRTSGMMPVISTQMNAYFEMNPELRSCQDSISDTEVTMLMKSGDLFRDSSHTDIVMPEKKAEVPVLAGKNATEAIALLEEAGFVYEIERELTEEEERGIVLRQSPEAGTRLKVGSKLVLVVNASEDDPIVTPTPVPTEAPTEAPTPTKEPTKAPTPTKAATPTPTKAPTPTPVPTPTKAPTQTPVPTPTKAATPTPTRAATPTPTKAPTPTPTKAPTPTPTKKPTKKPTPTPSGYRVGQTITFGTYEQDNNTKNGAEKIQWTVVKVSGDKALLVSTKVLTAREAVQLGTYTWADSSVRTWLNGSFYDTAFSSAEKEKILDTKLSNTANSTYGTAGGSDTTDKVFLLSIEEVKEFFSESAKQRSAATAYAVAKGANQQTLGCEWWLRTPGKDGDSVATVYAAGGINDRGRDKETGWVGIRPAIWITK